MRIEQVRDPSDEGRDRILNLLSAQAEEAGHPFRPQQWMFEAWKGEGYLGGVNARVGAEWVFIELLAVSAAARGKGVGRKLMEAVESEAREQGKIGIWVDTFSFQAPDFYRKLGFIEFGRIEGYPSGGARVFFAKRLDEQPHA
jgi:GNAT superfamily N-acetyltransferase